MASQYHAVMTDPTRRPTPIGPTGRTGRRGSGSGVSSPPRSSPPSSAGSWHTSTRAHTSVQPRPQPLLVTTLFPFHLPPDQQPFLTVPRQCRTARPAPSGPFAWQQTAHWPVAPSASRSPRPKRSRSRIEHTAGRRRRCDPRHSRTGTYTLSVSYENNIANDRLTEPRDMSLLVDGQFAGTLNFAVTNDWSETSWKASPPQSRSHRAAALSPSPAYRRFLPHQRLGDRTAVTVGNLAAKVDLDHASNLDVEGVFNTYVSTDRLTAPEAVGG